MGSLRSWLIRTTVLAVLGGAGALAWAVGEYVGPERVRLLFIAALQERMPDATIEVESAHLRLFGGVTATGVTVTRKGESAPILSAPYLKVAHDKERLHLGKLVIRKVELDGPTLRIARTADGWSWQGLLADRESGAPLPAVIVRNATVEFTDRRPEPLPPLTLTGFKFQLLNDPLTDVRIETNFTLATRPAGSAQGEVAPGLAVPVILAARFRRADPTLHLHVEVPELALTPDLVPAVAKLSPELAEHLAPLSGQLGVRADLKRNESGQSTYHVKLDLHGGRYDDPSLPWPLEHLNAALQYKDGRVTVDKATGRLGAAPVELSLETRPVADILAAVSAPVSPAAEGGKRPGFEQFAESGLEKLALSVREVPLDDDFFAKLPPAAGRTRKMLNPVGTVDINVSVGRTPSGALKREYDIRPHKLSISYEKFRYPVESLSGSVKLARTPDGTPEFVVAIDGLASGCPVKLTGTVGAEGKERQIDLKLSGYNFPIDARLVAAMPPKYASTFGKLRATGRADFSVLIRQQKDVDLSESSYRIRVYGGSVHPETFPYSLTDVGGRIEMRLSATNDPARLAKYETDRVEFHDFKATHGAGRLLLSAVREPVPDSPDCRVSVSIDGEKLPLDAELAHAIKLLNGGEAWAALSPSGKLHVAARVELIDRGGALNKIQQAAALPGEKGFSAARDLKVGAVFRGPTLLPKFFPYELTDVGGEMEYARGVVKLGRLAATHGVSALSVQGAELIFAPGGGVYANLGPAAVRPLALDADLMAALPVGAREALAKLKLSGPMDLAVKQLMVNVPGAAPPAGQLPSAPGAVIQARGQAPATETPAPGAPPAGPGPVVYWHGELKLRGVDLDPGVPLTQVHGAIASVGNYQWGGVGPVVGNAWLDRATVAGQPVTEAKISYNVRPAADPDTGAKVGPLAVEFPDLTATLLQGTLGGSARVTFPEGSAPRYRVLASATNIQLAELARTYHLGHGAELRGMAQGTLVLENPPDPVTGLATLSGVGQIDVPNGRMLNLPVLLPLLKLLKLQTPDQTAFEEAHASFELRGDRVRVGQLDLVGSALSLGGSGELNLKGDDVRFEFYTVWSQALRKWLATPLGDMTSALSGNLFRIDMTKRPGGEMQYKPNVLPAVTDPMKAVVERLKNRLGPVLDGPAPVYRAAPAR